MIENLKKYLKEEKFESFKKVFESNVINAHHRELLYELSYRQQSEKFYEYLETRVSLTNEKRANIFLKTIADSVKIKDFKTVEPIQDTILSSLMGRQIDSLMKSQSDEFIVNFMQSKPLTCFINFKKILYGGFKYEHVDFIDFVSKQQLDKNAVFYSSLCAVHFGKKDTFSTFIKNAMKYHPNILDEVRKMKDDYQMSMRTRMSYKDKEEFEAFINETLIDSFSKHLADALEEKKPLEVTQKPRRMKL